MAHQKNLKLQGTFGNVIFYTSNGQHLMRTKPEMVHQTNSTKHAASLFGKAANISANLRATLKSILPNSKDRNMMHRLHAALLNWLRAGGSAASDKETLVPFLCGFEFNEQSLLNEKFKLKFTIAQNAQIITLKIPAFNPVEKLVAPPHTSSIRLNIIIATCNFITQELIKNTSNKILIPYSSSEVAAQQIGFDLKPKSGDSCMAVIALNYYTSADGTTGLIDSIKWKPTAIAEAIIF